MQAENQKQRILYASIMLFANQGYEDVSLHQIADEMGIKTSVIFDYYQNKDAILHEIYDFYQKNIHARRLTPEAYDPILQYGSAEDIVNIFNYPLPEHIMAEMFYANMILWTRRYLDPHAKEIYLKTVVQDSYAYIDEVLNRGIKMGRIQMEQEEIKIFSAIALGIRENSANATVIDPDQRRWRIQETETNRMLARLLNVSPVPQAAEDHSTGSIPDQTRQSSAEYLINNCIKNESYAAGQYYYFADIAKREGDKYIVSLLKEIAENCVGNVIMLYNMMEDGKPEGYVPIDLNLTGILNEIIRNENRKATSKYPLFEKTAQSNELNDLANLLREIMDISRHYEKLCAAALKECSAQ